MLCAGNYGRKPSTILRRNSKNKMLLCLDVRLKKYIYIVPHLQLGKDTTFPIPLLIFYNKEYQDDHIKMVAKDTKPVTVLTIEKRQKYKDALTHRTRYSHKKSLLQKNI